MSEVYPTIDGFVGYGDGLETQLHSDEPWDSGHPLVKERPELFTAPEPAEESTTIVDVTPDPGFEEAALAAAAPRRRGRQSGSKNKPRAGTDG